MEELVDCPACSGSGLDSYKCCDGGEVPCERCDGDGVIWVRDDSLTGHSEYVCPRCRGERYLPCREPGCENGFITIACRICNGVKRVSSAVSIDYQAHQIALRMEEEEKRQREEAERIAAWEQAKAANEGTEAAVQEVFVPPTGIRPTSQAIALGRGIAGAAIGLVIVAISFALWTGLVGTKHPLLMLVALIWGIANFIGLIAAPIVGFFIGSSSGD